MRLVRPDLTKTVIESLGKASEWPHYAIFVCLTQYNSIVIAPRSYLHGDLFVILRQEWKQNGDGNVELSDPHIFDGHIEWEDDRSFVIRNESGQRVPPEIEVEIIRFLHSAES